MLLQLETYSQRRLRCQPQDPIQEAKEKAESRDENAVNRED